MVIRFFRLELKFSIIKLLTGAIPTPPAKKTSEFLLSTGKTNRPRASPTSITSPGFKFSKIFLNSEKPVRAQKIRLSSLGADAKENHRQLFSGSLVLIWGKINWANWPAKNR